MWWRNCIVLNYMFLVGIQGVNTAHSRLHLTKEKRIDYHKKRSPATMFLPSHNHSSNYSDLQNPLQMPTMTPSVGALTMLLEPLTGESRLTSLDKQEIDVKSTKASDSFRNINSYKKSTPKTIGKLMSDMYTYLFGTKKSKNGQTSTGLSDHAEPRVMLMTIGIINGIIAAGAALSMTGVMITGICVIIKMALAAMVVMAGYIYVI